MRRLAATSILSVFLACATFGTTDISPAPTTLEDYSIGENRSAGIGEPIFDVRTGLMRPGFRVNRTFDPDANDIPVLREGMRLSAIERVNEDGSLIIRNEQFPSLAALRVHPDGNLFPGYYNLYRAAMYSEGDIGWPDDLLTEESFVEEGDAAFRAEMIYSGMSGQTIRTVYREYSGNFIRPAFTQELQYDLSQDSTIAYRSIEIELLEASNSRLRFRVVEDDGLPWLPNF